MKNTFHTVLSICVFCILIQGSVHAKENPVSSKDKKSSQRTKAEGCVPASGVSELTINNVRCRINTGGDMWWDLQGNPQYFVPGNSQKTAMFSASLWIAGLDVNGQLKCAALRYRDGYDYWTGPLSTDGKASVDAETCDKYDKHFVMTRAEVEAFLGGEPPSKAILDWPAHGDLTKKQSYYLAPFYDNDGDGSYDPNNGDYPFYDLKGVYCKKPDKTAEGNGILADQVLKGDQTLWWVFNDKGNVHTETQGAAIGLEIRAQAFAFSTNDEINNMTFYSYEIINRSTFRLTETYFSQWVDTDLGDHLDDYVGCDVERGLGYCYNGKAVDGTGLPKHYGGPTPPPPAVGVDFFQGPYMDPDGLDNPKYTKTVDSLSGDTVSVQICDVSINGVNFGDKIIDNERFGMRRFVYHNNRGSSVPWYMQDPDVAAEYYNYLRGIWRDGQRMVYGGNAHPNSNAYGPECDFMFPGESDPCDWGTGGQPPNGEREWTEEKAGNKPYDRRFMQSAGPFTLEPGAVNYITVGIPWARASAGGPFASVELLRLVDDKCQRLFENCFKVVDGPDAPDLVIQELDKKLILYITNRKSSNNYNEQYTEFDPSIISPDTLSGADRWDSLYRFEGYQIFQVKDATVSVAELNDPDYARLVAQCDLKNYDANGNSIGRLVNYEYDESVGGNVPELKVNGENKGIVHSFHVTRDLFATEDDKLVNHKQYYFIAIAYAYNEYMKYSQDPGQQDPANGIGLEGQKTPYLAGRKTAAGPITSVVGIPHISSPEANGTKIQASYGSGPKIKRIEGQGNGGMVLDLTKETVDEIMKGYPHYDLHPIYENSKGPVNIKVIDPLNVAKGNYTLKFDVINEGIDFANWTLINTDNGDTFLSDRTIEIANEQLLLDLGLSITIQQAGKPGSANVENNGFLEATIEYADSSRKWLSGISDEDGQGDRNWIRSGTLKDADESENNDYDMASNNPLDENENYEKVLNGTWAPYRLCSSFENGLAFGASLVQNYLYNLASVDLVITPDKSKWTRCPVVETSENDVDNPTINTLSEGNALKFDLRKGKNVGKNGLPDNTIVNGVNYGMGWFPGYAINVETGERLNIMFGEDSWLIGENGRDMIWNPTANVYTTLGRTLFGGKHFVYIVGHNCDNNLYCAPKYDEGEWLHGKLKEGGTQNKRYAYKDILWAGIPLAVHGKEWLSNEVKIRLRVSKSYAQNYSTYGSSTPLNSNYPMYTFSTNDIETVTNDVEVAKTALDLINIVPNPYYAYSSYETNQIDNRVKITNLPEKCTISIYSINGVMIKQYTKDDTKTSLDWDLKNHAGIPISGGIYLIYVKADGIGERVIKWFGVLRPVDLNSF